MSEEKVIVINSLSKTYKLFPSTRHRLLEAVHPLRKRYHCRFEALKDITLSVSHGEVVGIIGRNGSGKSTLLKILASVVTPTSGTYSCDGRVTALLELSGGFNKEMTGIDNLYFLGGIQGYSRREMKERIGQILDFADIGIYAGQPVKNYSSGMYIRLAFSMAMHIDPAIMIIDEALSVGDMRFQQKCFRKIREFKDQGKTMLFCTHSMTAVRDFCTRVIWLNDGKVAEDGDPVTVTDHYSAFMNSRETDNLAAPESRQGKVQGSEHLQIIEWEGIGNCDVYGTGAAEIRQAALYDAESYRKLKIVNGGERLRVYLLIHVNEPMIKPGIMLVVNGQFGTPVLKFNNYLLKQPVRLTTGKSTVVAVDFTLPHIGNGNYSISAGILENTEGQISEIHWVHDLLLLEVANPDPLYRTGAQFALQHAVFQVTSL